MEQIFKDGVYYSPGRRVLYYFSVNRILPIVLVVVIVKIGLLFILGLVGLKQIIGASSTFLIIFGLLFCLIAFISAWIKYKSVQFMFDEFAFHIKKGFLNKSEIAIPYRQIQYINHSQSFNQKMLGIMNIIIETAGEDESRKGINNEGSLPILDSKIALSIEQELLRRSNVIPNATNRAQ